MNSSRQETSRESKIWTLGHVLEEFDHRLGSHAEPEILTLTEKMGFVSQRERFNKRLAIADTSNYKLIGLNDIAFNPYLLWAGAIAQNTRWEAAIISPLYPTFHIREGYNARFVNYLLCSEFLRSHYDGISFGSVPRKRRTAVGDFLNLRIPKPPSIVEQGRIVKLLDETDELRKLRLRANLRTAELIPALFNEMFGDTNNNPKQWSVVAFGELLAEPLRNGVSPASLGTYAARVLTLSAITGDQFDSAAWKEGVFAKPPDADRYASERLFLICRGSGNRELVGRAKFPFRLDGEQVFPDTMIAAVPKPDALVPIFLEEAWNLPSTCSQIASGARTTNGTFKINQTAIERIRLPVPPLPLQEEFAKRVRHIRDLETRQAASHSRIEHLFQSLLYREFRGEV